MVSDEVSGTEAASDPEVVRRIGYDNVWPADQLFPLTPLGAWYILQGWEVAPAAGMTGEQALALPGKVEAGAGWVRLWQA